jgi:hypothetical protein
MVFRTTILICNVLPKLLRCLPVIVEDEEFVVDVDDDGTVVSGLSLLRLLALGEVGDGIETSLALVVVGPEMGGDGLGLLVFPLAIGVVRQGQLH